MYYKYTNTFSIFPAILLWISCTVLYSFVLTYYKSVQYAVAFYAGIILILLLRYYNLRIIKL